MCTVTLTNLAHEVEHSLSVTAVDGAVRGAAQESVTFSPERVELFTGQWGTPVGNATWTETQGQVSTDGGTQASYLPMVDSGGSLFDQEDYSFQADFRIVGCSCDPAVGDPGYTGTEVPCDRFGISARYTDDDNQVLGYVEYKALDGCYLRIARKYTDSGTSYADVLGRSSYINTTIEQAPGVTREDVWGQPAYPLIPAIDDGGWHNLQISVDGQVVRIWLDGRLIASAQDAELESGSVALFSRREEIEWRNFSVWNAPW
jgi:hypothetical protein